MVASLREVGRRLTRPLRRSSAWRLYRAADLRHRPRGPLDGAHNEWSIIHPIESLPSDALVDIALRAVDGARTRDLSDVAARAPSRGDTLNHWPGDHYRLLPALAHAMGGEGRVVEVGTWRGASALAFLAEPSVTRVTTFDIAAWDSFDPTFIGPDDLGDRLEQRLGDLADTAFFASQRDLLADADVVFVDGPKDATFEPRFFAQLFAMRPDRRQLVVVDDIRVLPMVRLWRDLDADKLDLTSFGHYSGTGLVLRDR